MPRFVNITIGCDWADCTVEVPEEDATVAPTQLTLDKGKPKEFLLCKQHKKDLEDLVLPLMAAGVVIEAPAKKAGSGKKTSTETSSVAGRTGAGAETGAGDPTVARSGRAKETFACQEPGCGRTLTNRTGMAQHVIRGHGYENLAAYEERYPLIPDNHE